MNQCTNIALSGRQAYSNYGTWREPSSHVLRFSRPLYQILMEDEKNCFTDAVTNPFCWWEEGRGLLAELLCNKDQIQNVDHAIAVGVRDGFTETVGNLKRI